MQRGAYVAPGLFNMHPHVGEDPPTRYLAAGVTAIRDLGSPLGAFAAVDRDDASLIRPRIWFSGPILNAGRVVRGPLLDINPRRILEAEGVSAFRSFQAFP